MNETAVQLPIYQTPVFVSTITATEPIVGNQGGTWSGKTFSILQALLFLTISTEYRDDEGRLEPIVTTVVGQDVPNLKKGAISDFYNIMDIVVNSFPDNLQHFFKYDYHQSNKVATFSNGSKIEFSSFKNWQDAKSGKRHYLFINEANGIPYKIAEQLMFRVKIRTFVDYNPDAPFWFHHKYIGKAGVKMIYSNHTHNKFVPDKVRRELIAKGEENPEFKKVYVLGKTGKTQGVIFPNVRWVTEMPKVYKKESYGMDFGFTNDPTTLVRIVLAEGVLYAELLIYEKGLTTGAITKRMEDLGIPKDTVVYADSASPLTIKEIKLKGYRKIKGAKKGANSIVEGINGIKDYGKLHIVDNVHVRAEQLSYVWTEDKLTGLPTNKPIDDFNHFWDAKRYGMQGIIKRTRTAVSSS